MKRQISREFWFCTANTSNSHVDLLSGTMFLGNDTKCGRRNLEEMNTIKTRNLSFLNYVRIVPKIFKETNL